NAGLSATVTYFGLANAINKADQSNIDAVKTYVDNYTINAWNTVELDTPIAVAENSEYFVVIDCYDVAPNSYPLAVDTTFPYTFYSDLYSLDGQSWDSIASTAIYGNWMIGLDVESTEESKLPIVGYDVNIDGVSINDETLTATNTTFTFPAVDTQKHTISVDTNYPAGVVKRGAANYFYLSGSGVENVVANITLLQGANMLTVSGGEVSSLRLFSVAGALVRAAEGNTVALDGLAQGVYVVRATVDGERVIRKIRISK
ncbi:MAG: T9SS type A sorting domain-containing protein, partial [Muribaculaceae bacterium]